MHNSEENKNCWEAVEPKQKLGRLRDHSRSLVSQPWHVHLLLASWCGVCSGNVTTIASWLKLSASLQGAR